MAEGGLFHRREPWHDALHLGVGLRTCANERGLDFTASTDTRYFPRHSLRDGAQFAVDELKAEGWLRGTKPAAAGGAMVGDVWGRPADVLVMPDGSLLVSDDKAGVIYRITYGK